MQYTTTYHIQSRVGICFLLKILGRDNPFTGREIKYDSSWCPAFTFIIAYWYLPLIILNSLLSLYFNLQFSINCLTFGINNFVKYGFLYPLSNSLPVKSLVNKKNIRIHEVDYGWWNSSCICVRKQDIIFYCYFLNNR